MNFGIRILNKIRINIKVIMINNFGFKYLAQLHSMYFIPLKEIRNLHLLLLD